MADDSLDGGSETGGESSAAHAKDEEMQSLSDSGQLSLSEGDAGEGERDGELGEWDASEGDAGEEERDVEPGEWDASEGDAGEGERDVEPGEWDASEGDIAAQEATGGPEIPHQEFMIPINQFVCFTNYEIGVIDHPAFQRLFTIQQLGQTDLVYRGATHKRGEHALGSVAVVDSMIEAVNQAAIRAPRDQQGQWEMGPPLSTPEIAFARLSALLHDIGHISAGHTLEDELGLLGAHDGSKRITMILDKVIWGNENIRKMAKPLNETLRERVDRLYGRLAEGANMRYEGSSKQLTASEILLHVIAKDFKSLEPIYCGNLDAHGGLGTTFRINLLRDLVGNTVCADLIDYLHRDFMYIGKPRQLDTRLLHYMEIRTHINNDARSHVVVNIQSSRPDRYRPDAISEILGLLGSRYELWEIALLHRTKTGAAAMLERALAEIADRIGFFDADEDQRAGIEEALLKSIIEATDIELYSILSNLDLGEVMGITTGGSRSSAYRDILWKLKHRVLFKEVSRAGNDRYKIEISNLFAPSKAKSEISTINDEERQNKTLAAKNRLESLRALEWQFGLKSGSLAMYCVPRGLGRKLAEVWVLHDKRVQRLNEAEENAHDKISGGHLAAQLRRFDHLWRASLFASPEALNYLKRRNLVHLLRSTFEIGVLGLDIETRTVNSPDQVLTMRDVAKSITSSDLVDTPDHLRGRTLLEVPLEAARGESESVKFPSEQPTISAYLA